MHDIVVVYHVTSPAVTHTIHRFVWCDVMAVYIYCLYCFVFRVVMDKEEGTVMPIGLGHSLPCHRVTVMQTGQSVDTVMLTEQLLLCHKATVMQTGHLLLCHLVIRVVC